MTKKNDDHCVYDNGYFKIIVNAKKNRGEVKIIVQNHHELEVVLKPLKFGKGHTSVYGFDYRILDNVQEEISFSDSKGDTVCVLEKDGKR